MADRPSLHEVLLVGLGGVLSLALLLTAGVRAPVTLEVAGTTGLFAAGVALLARLDARAHAFRVRLLLAYAATFSFYAAVERVVPALHLPLRDAWLLAADRWLFGETPAVWLQRWSAPAVSELFSASYLSFHAYLHLAMAWALVGPRARAERFFTTVFSAYALGIAGYSLVPAVGPVAAFPDLFRAPVEGGAFTRWNAAVVAWGSSTYDVFPSLHTSITLVLLAHDRQAHPWRFRLLLLPGAALVLSTLVLRYHYAVDVLAGALLFVAHRALHPWAARLLSGGTGGPLPLGARGSSG